MVQSNLRIVFGIRKKRMCQMFKNNDLKLIILNNNATNNFVLILETWTSKRLTLFGRFNNHSRNRKNMVTFGSVVLICLTVICCFLVLTAYRINMREITVKDRNRLQKIIEKNPSHYVEKDKIDTRCEICFGDIGNEIIRACSCGKTFHVDCSNATGECPYCKAKNESMTIRNAVKTVCPACGRIIENNICDCGLILPNRDGTYECRCGETMSVTDEKCHKCGSSLKVEIGN